MKGDINYLRLEKVGIRAAIAAHKLCNLSYDVIVIYYYHKKYIVANI